MTTSPQELNADIAAIDQEWGEFLARVGEYFTEADRRLRRSIRNVCIGLGSITVGAATELAASHLDNPYIGAAGLATLAGGVILFGAEVIKEFVIETQPPEAQAISAQLEHPD